MAFSNVIIVATGNALAGIGLGPRLIVRRPVQEDREWLSGNFQKILGTLRLAWRVVGV